MTGIGAPPWHIHNMYRARPAKSSLSVDLQGTVVDACFTGCKGEARAKFSLQILNTGTQNTELGISVAMYAMLGGKKELIQVQEYPKRLGPGQASAAILFDVDISRIGGEVSSLSSMTTGLVSTNTKSVMRTITRLYGRIYPVNKVQP